MGVHITSRWKLSLDLAADVFSNHVEVKWIGRKPLNIFWINVLVMQYLKSRVTAGYQFIYQVILIEVIPNHVSGLQYVQGFGITDGVSFQEVLFKFVGFPQHGNLFGV